MSKKYHPNAPFELWDKHDDCSSEKKHFNPKEGRDCNSCGYIENKIGTTHKACMRNFQVGRYLPAHLKNNNTGKTEEVIVFIDQTSAKMVIKGEMKVQVACTTKINQWTRMFPLDFAPIWIVVCTGWSEERDKQFIREETPFDQMMGILGSVGRI